MKILITARPGVGKSFITKALSDRGYNAHDLEEVPHAIGLEYKATGKSAEWPTGFVDWNVYAWNMRPEIIRDFLDQLDGDVFVSGAANNQVELYQLFDKIVILTLDDPEVLRHRLETRNVHEFGQDPENINRSVQRFLDKQSELLSHGGIAINNQRPVDQVIEDIIQILR